ncbi:MAG: hypothetical protein ACRC1D_07700, partial [Culicoidibacterales bacterium]
ITLILNMENIMRYEKQFEEISAMNHLKILRFIINKQLIQEIQSCANCNAQMRLYKTTDCADGYNWRCFNSRCNKFRTTTTIRKGSKFENIGIDFKRLLKYYVCGL